MRFLKLLYIIKLWGNFDVYPQVTRLLSDHLLVNSEAIG